MTLIYLSSFVLLDCRLSRLMTSFQALVLTPRQTTMSSLMCSTNWTKISWLLGRFEQKNLCDIFFCTIFFKFVRKVRMFLRLIVVGMVVILIGLESKCDVIRGKMVFKGPTVQFLQNGIGLMTFKWRTRLGASSTSRLSISREQRGGLVPLWSTIGPSLTFPSLSLMGILRFLLATGTPRTTR